MGKRGGKQGAEGGKGAMPQGGKEGNANLSPELRSILQQHQGRNMSGLLKNLESIGVRFKGATKGKGKGKGKDNSHLPAP